MTARVPDAELIEGLIQALHTSATAMEHAVYRLTDAGTMSKREVGQLRDVAQAARELVGICRIARS